MHPGQQRFPQESQPSITVSAVYDRAFCSNRLALLQGAIVSGTARPFRRLEIMQIVIENQEGCQTTLKLCLQLQLGPFARPVYRFTILFSKGTSPRDGIAVCLTLEF